MPMAGGRMADPVLISLPPFRRQLGLKLEQRKGRWICWSSTIWKGAIEN